jgi:hypothetical protein
VWYYRRDKSPEALLGVLVILLSFIYMFTYDAVAAPLGFTMLAYALMWKASMHRRDTDQLAQLHQARPLPVSA